MKRGNGQKTSKTPGENAVEYFQQLLNDIGKFKIDPDGRFQAVADADTDFANSSPEDLQRLFNVSMLEAAHYPETSNEWGVEYSSGGKMKNIDLIIQTQPKEVGKVLSQVIFISCIAESMTSMSGITNRTIDTMSKCQKGLMRCVVYIMNKKFKPDEAELVSLIDTYSPQYNIKNLPKLSTRVQGKDKAVLKVINKAVKGAKAAGKAQKVKAKAAVKALEALEKKAEGPEEQKSLLADDAVNYGTSTNA